MRKKVMTQDTTDASSTEGGWLDLDRLAQVEVTSEDPAHLSKTRYYSVGKTVGALCSPGSSGFGWNSTSPRPPAYRAGVRRARKAAHSGICVALVIARRVACPGDRASAV